MSQFPCHAIALVLPKEIGYATIKLFDFSHLGYSGVLAKVARQITHDPTTDTSSIDDGDLMFGARSVSFYPLKPDGKNIFKVSTSKLSETDFIIPDFKWTNARTLWVEDERTLPSWFPLHVLSVYGNKTPYERLSHLERTTVYDMNSLRFRIVFEVCRMRNLPLEQFYTIDGNSDVERVMLEAMNTPIYSAIPANLRGVCAGTESLDRDIRNLKQSKR